MRWWKRLDVSGGHGCGCGGAPAAASRREVLRAMLGVAVALGAPAVGAATLDRGRAIAGWRRRLQLILERGIIPIIDTEFTYNLRVDLDFIIEEMNANGVAQICMAPGDNRTSGVSLELHRRHPDLFIPTTKDGSSPEWYHNTKSFAETLGKDLAQGDYFLMGEFELRHYPSPNQYHAGKTDRDVTVPLDDPGVEAVFRLAETTGIALQIHYEVEDVLLPPLEALLARHPKAKVIWCHLGQVRLPGRARRYGPDYVVSLLDRFPNLYFDLGLPGPRHVHPMSGERDQMIYIPGDTNQWRGELAESWKTILESQADRFLAASDMDGQRYRNFPQTIRRLRDLVISQLGPRAQKLIGFANAWKLITGETWPT